MAPRWPRLRAQVVHGDLNLDNVLLDERSRVAGIVDFGDCGYTAQAGDFAVALASIMRGRPEDDVFRVARIASTATRRGSRSSRSSSRCSETSSPRGSR